MASLLITKADEKLGSVVTINGKGIYYQELRLGDRPMSPRVKLGCLTVVDGEIMADYSEWSEYDSLLVSRSTAEKTKAAAKAVLETLKKEGNTDGVTRKTEEVEKQAGAIARLEKQITEHPIYVLAALSPKIMANVDKMLDKVRFKHQHLEATDKSVSFSHHPTREYFIQRQAEDLLKRHNENLELRGVEEGYLDYDAALEIIEKRFAPKAKPAKAIAKPAFIVDTIIKAYESATNKVQFLKDLDTEQFNGLCKHFNVKGTKTVKIAELVKVIIPVKV